MVNKLLSTEINNDKTHLALLVLRLSMGALLLTHGWAKLMRVMGGEMAFADPLGIGAGASLVLATFAEFLCVLFVIAGLFTRFAAIPVVLNMSTAFFIYHAADSFGQKEKALLFLLGFVVILIAGAGKYSLDYKIFGGTGGTADTRPSRPESRS